MEFIEIFEALPVEKKIEVTDFARFLFEKSEDNRWEQIINGEKARIKLEEYARICEEEDAEPLELEKTVKLECPAKLLARLLCLGFRSAQRCQKGIQTF